MRTYILIGVFIFNFVFITFSFSQKLGRYTVEEWQTIIDNTWGEGLSTDRKLVLFDRAWNMIDNEYACFQNLDIDWNALKELYRPEIAAGVSRGRFSAIMTYLTLALRETHTYLLDTQVAWDTALKPGIPLFVGG